jgi:hypothetical protein
MYCCGDWPFTGLIGAQDATDGGKIAQKFALVSCGTEGVGVQANVLNENAANRIAQPDKILFLMSKLLMLILMTIAPMIQNKN